MTCAHRSVYFVIVLIFAAGIASAQTPPATGTPPFGSFAGGPDIINLADLNSHICVPVLHKPGRGTNFLFDLCYDSSVWYPVTSGSTTTWQPTSASNGWTSSLQYGGYVSHSTSISRYYTYCGPHNTPRYAYITTDTYSNWAYVDGRGTAHPYPAGDTSYMQLNGCTGDDSYGFFSDIPLDGSGYKLTINGASITSLYATNGALVNLGGNLPYQDRNGNQITLTNVSGTTNYYDTLSSTTPVLTVAGTAPSNTTFTYTAPSGASPSYTMKYTNYTVATNFGVSGISEYKSLAAVPLVSSIVLPDNSAYIFAYETTPGTCTPYAGTTCTTARVTSISLPTGGTITYSYSGGNNGILPDGSAATLTRTTPDGTWTYAQVKGAGAASTTTVTDPQGNQTVVQFQGIYATQGQVYQGSSSSGTLLATTNTCYNGSASPCTSTAVTLPITERGVTAQLGSTSGPESLHIDYYNSYGMPTSTYDYDYGAAPHGSLLRYITYAYASLGNITAFRQQVTVFNGAGTQVAQTNYNYDETTPTATSGVAQHTSVTGSRGNLTSINYPVSGLTEHLTYYDTGSISTDQDVNGAVTTYNYSSTNNADCQMAFPTSISEPLSLSRSMTWNCTGGVQLTATDENNQTTTTTYNDPYFWRPASVSFPDGGLTSWTYNSLTSVTTATKMNSSQNIVTTQLLDGLGRPSQGQLNSDPLGVDYTVTTYDALGRTASVYNPTRCNPPTSSCGEYTWGITSYQYDALSRPTSITDPDGSVFTASYSNNTITAADPAGKKRTSTYDSLGRLTQLTEDPSGLAYVTTYTYDALGDLLTVTQNGSRQRTFVYDGLSRLTSETNPESGTVTYGYDASPNAGDLTSRVAPAPNQTGSSTVTTTYTYDALHRLTSKSYSNGSPSMYYSYDVSPSYMPGLTNVIGRLVTANNQFAGATGEGTDIVNSYDAMGRITQQWQQTPMLAPGGVPLYYTYDLAGNMTSYGTGNSVNTFSQVLDSAGRVTQLTSSDVDSQHPSPLVTVDPSVGFYPTGQLRKMTFGNGITESAYIEPRLQPGIINLNTSGSLANGWGQAAPSGTIEQFSYLYGNWGSTNSGNITYMGASGTSQNFTRWYAYDSLNRLATMSAPGDSCSGLSWTYDAWGNRTDQTTTGGTCNTFHQTVNTQNRLVGPPYQYDAAGNVTQDASHTYTYDAENRLISVDGGSTASYAYEALGRRVQKTMGSTITNYLYDLSGNVVSEINNVCASICWWAFYINMGGQRVAEYRAGTTYFVHKDALGSTRLLTGMNQAVAQNVDYLPFGEIISSDSGLTPHQFTGDERDAETGLDHTWFRQYSSPMGRWMTPDPADLAAVDPTNPQSWNRYAYVLNNPLRAADPLGLSCIDITWIDENGDEQEGLADDGDGLGCAGAGVGPGDSPDDITPDQVDVNADALGGNSSISIWDFFSVPWSGTVLVPLVPFGPFASGGAGPTFAYNPKTDTGCLGLAAGAMVPATGRAAAFGPLTVGNIGNADNILAGGSVFGGGQATPALGVQAVGNSSGLLAGPTFGTPGIAAGASASGCKAGVGKKLLSWLLDNFIL